MSYCKNCGAQKADNAPHCPNCGASDPAGQARSFVDQMGNTADYTCQMDPRDISENKIMAILAYLSWLILIPIFAAPNSRFARFHINQALPLVIASFVLSILGGVMTFILWPLGLLFWLADIGICVLIILGIINAAQGRAKELPITGKIRIYN